MKPEKRVTLSDLERETGFSKDLLRKWRTRYGFPAPTENNGAEQGFAASTVQQLQLIKRLLDSGCRPAQVVGKSSAELERWANSFVATCIDVKLADITQAALTYAQANDFTGLTQLLSNERGRQSAADFVRTTLVPLLDALGNQWERGKLAVYQEHLCTSVIVSFLQRDLSHARPKPGYPRILLALPREESHVIGLLMTQTVLGDLGAECINIGQHVSVADLVEAARACQADIVGLSFSFSFPKGRVQPVITALRAQLPNTVDLWVGGAGTKHVNAALLKVQVFHDLYQAETALNSCLHMSTTL